MIQQEAIKFLEETKVGCNFTRDKQLFDVCNIAISAIEKQIPKKVEHLECYPTDRDCPNCFSNLASYDKTIQHCPIADRLLIGVMINDFSRTVIYCLRNFGNYISS